MQELLQVRKGLDGYRYSLCNKDGEWINSFDAMLDIYQIYGNRMQAKEIALEKHLELEPINAKNVGKEKMILEYLDILDEYTKRLINPKSLPEGTLKQMQKQLHELRSKLGMDEITLTK